MNRVFGEASRWVLCIGLGACFEGCWQKLVAQTIPATQEASSYSLILRIHDYARVKPGTLSPAKGIVGHVFSATGIKLIWLDIPVHSLTPRAAFRIREAP